MATGVSTGGDYSAPPDHFHHANNRTFLRLLMELSSIGPIFGRLGLVSIRVEGGAEVEAA